MRKLLGFVLLFVVISLPVSTQAQDQKTPIYAFVFGAGEDFSSAETVYVAFGYDDNTWEIKPLPRILFGQYDISLVTPYWAENGKLIGAAFSADPQIEPTIDPEFDPGYRTTGDAVVYDIFTGNLTSTAMPTDNLFDIAAPLFLAPNAVSPDGRYATFHELSGRTGYLVDLQNNKVLTAVDPCGLKAFAWEVDSVYVGTFSSYIACPPQFFQVDLNTGERIQDFTPLFEGIDVTVFDGAIRLGENDFLMAVYGLETYYSLIRVQADKVSIIAPYDGFGIDQVVLSQDSQAAAFLSNGALMVLDLSTMQLSTASESGISPFYFEGNVLHFAESISTADGVQLVAKTFSPDAEGTTTVLYEGVDPIYFAFSPSQPAVALTLPDGSAQVHGGEGLIWDSSTTDYDNIKGDSVYWSEDGIWAEFLQEDLTSLKVNVQTGEFVPAPEAGATFVNTSPDGKWWLYQGSYDPSTALAEGELGNATSVFVYDPESGEKVVILEDTDVFHNFHFSYLDYYIWSP